MKRSILAAAIAALFATTFGTAAILLAAPPVIHDPNVMPASAVALAQEQAAANAAEWSADESAGDCAACNECLDCGTNLGLIFAEFDGLGWWRKSRPLPPLVTTRTTGGVLEPNAGALGLPTTVLLFGGDNYSEIEAGGRLNLGFLGRDRCWGAGGDFFILGEDTTNYSRTAANQFDILAIPFFDVANNAQGRLAVNYPGFASGGRVDISSSNDAMGANAYGRYLIWAEDNLRVDAIGGYQFARIDDSLFIHANYNDLTGIPNVNQDITDLFNVQNEFHGGTLGLLTEWSWGPFMVRGMAKVGLGNMHQSASVNGATITTPAGGLPPSTAPQGLFAQPSNIGVYEQDDFCVVPEARLNLGYRLNENWTASLGYTFIYFSDVVTAGNILDRDIDVRQIPPLNQVATQPAFAFGERTDFWLQGFNLSLEFAY